MNNHFKLGKPLNVTWHFNRPDGENYSLAGLQHELVCYNSRGRFKIKDSVINVEDTGALSFTLTEEMQTVEGAYSFHLSLLRHGTTVNTIVKNDAIILSKHIIDTDSIQEDEPTTIDIFSVGEFELFRPTAPVAGSDGWWYFDGQPILDDEGNKVPINVTLTIDNDPDSPTYGTIVFDKDRDGNRELTFTGMTDTLIKVNNQGDEAERQGNVAEEQGNVAKAQGDEAERQGNVTEAQGNEAERQGNYAVEKGDEAVQIATEKGDQAISTANAASTYARQQGDNAVQIANTAAENANDMATLANEKATLADQKATLANEKAILADQKAAEAVVAKENADTATANANTATTNANNATTNANNAAQEARDGIAEMVTAVENAKDDIIKEVEEGKLAELESDSIIVKEILNYTTLDLSQYNPINGYILNGVWRDVNSSDRQHIIIPLNEFDLIKIHANKDSISNILFLSDYNIYNIVEGGSASVIGNLITIPANQIKSYNVPQGAVYLYVQYNSGSYIYLPSNIVVGKNQVDLNSSNIEHILNSKLNTKKIVIRSFEDLKKYTKTSEYNSGEVGARIYFSQITLLKNSNISINTNNGYEVAFLLYNSNDEVVYDSNWQNQISSDVVSLHGYKYAEIAFRKADNSATSVEDIVQNAISNMSIDCIVQEYEHILDVSLLQFIFQNIEDLSNSIYPLISRTINGINLPFELGHIDTDVSPWVYEDYDFRVRIKEGHLIPLKKGAIMSLTNYTDYRFFVSWKIDGVEYRYNRWLKSDYVCDVDADYSVLIARNAGEEIELSDVSELSSLFNIFIEGEIDKNSNNLTIRNIAHQGYSITDSYYGNNLAEGYIKAAEIGFNFGECDIVFSSDAVPFCSHGIKINNVWVDAFEDDNGEVVYFSDNTAEDIKSHLYFGTTVSTFEEVIAACKSVGIGLYIDKLPKIDTDEKWTTVFNIIKKYAMCEKVVFMPTTLQEAQKVFSLYPEAKISIITSIANGIDIANQVKMPYNDVRIDVDYSLYTIENIAEAYEQLNPGIGIDVYTIDDLAKFKEYLPFVSGITSDKLCERIV